MVAVGEGVAFAATYGGRGYGGNGERQPTVANT